MATPVLFATMWNGYTTTLVQGSQTAATGLLAAIGPWLTGAMMLFVLVCGIMMMLQRLNWNTSALYAVRCLAIANLLTAPLYNQYVMTPFLTTIPQAIASGLGTNDNSLTVPQQLDAIQSALDRFEAPLLAAASGLTQIGPRVEIALAHGFASLMLVGVFVVALLSYAIVAIVAPAGAVLLVFYLFDATRGWAMGWVSKMVALMILQLLLAILISIVVTQDQAFMTQAEASASSGINLDELISLLWSIGFSFLIGVVLLIALPGIAAAIGGTHISPLVMLPIAFSARALVGASGTAAMQAHAGAKVGAQAARRAGVGVARYTANAVRGSSASAGSGSTPPSSS